MRAAVCKRGERDAVAVAQMMMAADGHAIAQSAKPQRSLEVGHALVAVCGIVAVAADGRADLVAGGTMAVDSLVWRLFAAVDLGGHAAADGIGDQAVGCDQRS